MPTPDEYLELLARAKKAEARVEELEGCLKRQSVLLHEKMDRVWELEDVLTSIYSAAEIFNHDGDSIWDTTKKRVLRVMPSLKG